MLTVTAPKAMPVAIVELTFDKSVDDLPAMSGGEVSAFNDPVTYGHIVSRQAKVIAIPGRKARYLRFELKPAKPEYLHLRQVEVIGKD